MINKVTLVGNLGADIELRQAGSESVAELRLATSDAYIDKSGEKKETTEWHRVVVWGKTAENCAKYLKKGSRVYVDGKIQTRTFDDKDGNKRYVTEIKAFDVKFLDGKPAAESSGVNFAKRLAPKGKKQITQLPED